MKRQHRDARLSGAAADSHARRVLIDEARAAMAEPDPLRGSTVARTVVETVALLTRADAHASP